MDFIDFMDLDFNFATLTLLSIPLISAFVGWFTNFLALKMMFYPMEFVGIKPIWGWQGLIPAKRQEMAEIASDLILDKLLNVKDLAFKIDSKEFTKEIERRLKQVIRRIVDDIMRDVAPQSWAALPVHVKKLVYLRIESDLPNVLYKLVEDFKHNSEEIIDIKEMIVTKLIESPEIINEIFLKAGDKEFPFVEHSGFVFGFLFGFPTMLVWAFYPEWWVLPLGGLIVGYLTNWLALKIIFEPKQPTKILWFTFQGMFLKRQDEVARVYSEIIEEKLVTPKNILEAALTGSGSEQLLELIELHIHDAIDRYIAIAQPYFTLGVGSDTYYNMRERTSKRIFSDSRKYVPYAFEYLTKTLGVAEELCDRMKKLTPEEFEGVLRPAYEADEWKLIVTGSLLGMWAGFMQLYFMFL